MSRLFRSDGLALLGSESERFAVMRIGIGVRLIAIRLTRLGQQDQRRGVGGLETESEIKKNERIDIEMNDAGDIENDPTRDEQGLADQKRGSSEKSGECLSFQREPIVAESGHEMRVRQVKAKRVPFRNGLVRRGLRFGSHGLS